MAATMKRNFLAVLIGASLALSGCASDPEGNKVLMLVDDKQMTSMGLSAFDEMKAKQRVSADPMINQYVQCITNKLIAELPDQDRNQAWEVLVFEDDTPNAFALPGGKVGVHTGLLKVAQTEDQLAAVIGHELAHVQYKHGNQRVSQQLVAQAAGQVAQMYLSQDGVTQRDQYLDAAIGIGVQVGVLLPFSRKHERQADKAGQVLMARAGYDPREAGALWGNMMQAAGSTPPKWLSTHPDPEKRMENLGNRSTDLMPLMETARTQGKAPGCRK